ncbi:MAG: DUF1611 domain-containing protein [Niameybacter sp.]|uniref:DUF1611 domain-containing protein n=1 Tax=Niameybacter sp. TaxID=2033640 RepID=UPI002FC58279
MKKVRVVIIDSGVNTAHKLCINDNIKGFSFQKGIIKQEFEDLYGHGTAIYNIIKQSIRNVEIINVKIMEKSEEECDIENLIEVLRYINENIEVDVINLSLGVSIIEEHNKLEECCMKLANKGVIIVSAFDNYGSMSYPAMFEDVIGVTTGKSCVKNDMFEYIESKVVNIAANGSVQKLAWVDPPFLAMGGNSFACAHVTCQVIKFIQQGRSGLKDVLQGFKNIAIKIYEIEDEKNKKQKEIEIKRAAIFPFNKEVQNILAFQELLTFSIDAIYDVKYSFKVGRKISEIIKHKELVNDFVIKDIESIEFGKIDTLILGHMEDLLTYINKDDFRNKVIEKALSNGVQIYSFDDITNVYSDNTIHSPIVGRDDAPPNLYGKLYKSSRPIVGVFGTSSKQGKFTLQLRLRKELQERGFEIGQIGTEPNALLFGMDYVYPMGYNSSAYINGFDAIRYLNSIIHRLCIQKKDIILIGSQSGTISYDNSNLTQYNLPQYEFLLGCQPDAVFLSINPYDDFEYIERTIRFIESSVEAKILAIVIFPLDINKGWQGFYGSKVEITTERYNDLKGDIEKRFKIPVYRSDRDQDIKKLVDRVEEYFE